MSDIWSWNNAIDAAGTLISSDVGSAGELLTQNIRDPRISKIWRAPSTPATLTISFPVTGAISIFGLFGLNYASLGTITLRLGTTEGAGDLWEMTFSPTSKQAVFVLLDEDGALAPVGANFASIIANDGSPIEIGRVWIGGADWQATIAHSVDGSKWGGGDKSNVTITPRSNAFLVDRGARFRTFTANYEMLTPEEYAGSLFEMDERGTAQQMLFVPVVSVYDPNRFAILGYLREIPDTNWRALFTAGRPITITENG